MAGYDNSKDKVLESMILTSESGSDRGYEVSLCSYDGGDIKVQISPFYTDREGDKKYSKLGRIKLSWFIRIAQAVRQMQEKIK